MSTHLGSFIGSFIEGAIGGAIVVVVVTVSEWGFQKLSAIWQKRKTPAVVTSDLDRYWDQAKQYRDQVHHGQDSHPRMTYVPDGDGGVAPTPLPCFRCGSTNLLQLVKRGVGGPNVCFDTEACLKRQQGKVIPSMPRFEVRQVGIMPETLKDAMKAKRDAYLTESAQQIRSQAEAEARGRD